MLNSEDDSLYELRKWHRIGGSFGYRCTKLRFNHDCTRDVLMEHQLTDEVFTIDYTTGQAHSFIQTTVPLKRFGIEYDVQTNSVLLVWF